MTEETILKCLDILQSNISKSYFAQNVSYCEMHALVESKKIIEAIQQYRTIGTIEECREARERQKPKIADIWGDGYADGNLVYDTYECPNCGATYELGCDEYKYCPKCGQAMDLSK